MISKTQILAREKKWALPIGIASVLGVALFFVGQAVGSSNLGSPEGTAEILEAASEHSSTVILGSGIQGLGIAMLAIPLVYLFFAALVRSDSMRRGFVLVAIVGPAFVGLGTFISAVSLTSAAGDWEGDATPGVTKCFEDTAADSAGSPDSAEPANSSSLTEEQKDDCRDEVADDLRSDAGIAGLALGLLASGALGFLVGLFYTARNAMRVGLLSRFWGSLGMAVGVILILPTLQILALAWFIYLGLLVAGWVPNKPRAWAEGVAVPWPIPGQPSADDEVIEGSAEEIDESTSEIDAGEEDVPDEGPQGERRKRKKRN